MNATDEMARTKALIKPLSKILNEIIEENQNINKAELKKSLFYAKSPPSIALDAYLERILKYSKLEESTLIISLIYIDRVCENNNFDLTAFNIHRLMLTAILTAIKYNEDDFYSNTYYAKVGGISLQEINNLESEFLNLIKFNLWIDSEIFMKYQNYLEQY